GRAAAHGEVVAADHHRAAIDLGAAEHEVRRREGDQVVVGVVARAAGDLADLVEAAGVGELGDPLEDRQATAVVLALHALGPAQLRGELLATPQLVQLLLPIHAAPARSSFLRRPSSPRYGNRHGLVAGATGTGKTISLMVMAEGFSRLGVPVFMADVKGDVAGLAMAGTSNDKIQNASPRSASRVTPTKRAPSCSGTCT